MVLTQATQIVSGFPWWAPYLIGGTGVVVGAILTQIATLFNDKRKLNAEKESKRRDRMLDALGRFLAASEAAGNLELLSVKETAKLKSEVDSLIESPDADLEHLQSKLNLLQKDLDHTLKAHREQLSEVTRTYTILVTVASKRTIGYATALYGTSKTLAMHRDDAVLRDNFVYLLHALPHVAREEMGLKNEVDAPLLPELEKITDYTTNLLKGNAD